MDRLPPAIDPSLRRRVVSFVTLSWVPLAGATLSLILSVTSIVISTREPEVILIVPELVRVAQGEDYGYAYMYIQPAIVSTGQNDRVEVIRDMRVLVEPEADDGETITFEWDEQARLVSDEDGELTYEYVADAVPLLVGPRAAQVPFSVFNGPDGWYFEPGTYRLTIEAERVVASQPLRGSFQITLSEDDVALLERSRGNRFVTLPTSEASHGS